MTMNVLTLSQRYEENTIARIIVNAIPYVGSSLDVALSSRWEQYQTERVTDLLNKIEKELSELKLEKVDKAFLESEAFFDLVYQIASKAISNRISEIRTGYAKIIKSAIKGEETISNLEELVWQLSDLQTKDVLFIRKIKELYDSGREVTGIVLSRELHGYGYSPIECEWYLYRFENLGLLDHPRNMINGRGKIFFQKMPLFDKISNYMGL